jgi:hypothetical protein
MTLPLKRRCLGIAAMARLPFAIFLLLPVAAAAQDKPPPAPDHGRGLACALDVFPHKLKDTTNLADTKNYVFRGKVISLGKDKKISICYDTEHMRVAGAWVGKPMAFSADKNMGPTVEGEMLFSTRPGPGWAKAGKWDDPREGKEGPLPRDWAHYKGLYLYGDKVVLSYTVGDMDVLELPEVIEKAGRFVIVRTIQFSESKKKGRILLCDESDGRGFTEYAIGGRGATGGIRGATLRGKDWTIDFRLSRFHDGTFDGDGGRVYLDIKRFADGGNHGGRFRIEILKHNNKDDVLPIVASDAEELAKYTKGGPPRWTETIETTVSLGDDKAGPYTLDRIQLPEKNPWNASIRFAGLDFFADGRAALCTWDGDVWIVSGLDDALKKVRWKRFAAGLQQPLGLKIIDGYIYVAGRDQITKLHDLNNDGEADFYENFNNDAGLTLQRHEFVMDLQTDQAGNLYYCRSGHYIQSKRGDNCCIYKLSKDGKKLEKFAKGFREPNGMSIGPDGTMTVADNEGNGVPQTPIYRLLPGKDYGFTASTTGNPNQGSYKFLEKPIVWLGPKVDGSAGGQVWAPVANASGSSKEKRAGSVSDGPAWGPLAGKLLHTSYGNCALFHVMIDKTAEPWQGAVWKFPLTFDSGIMRARFNPKDGQLYVCGLRGWGTSAVKDGQFARIRYTGAKTPIPLGYRVVKGGLEFTFSEPLDKASAEDDDNWAGTWSGVLKKVPRPNEMQEMPIASVKLSADRKTVTIGVDKLKAVPNFALQYRIKAADGAKVSGEINGTIHRVP